MDRGLKFVLIIGLLFFVIAIAMLYGADFALSKNCETLATLLYIGSIILFFMATISAFAIALLWKSEIITKALVLGGVAVGIRMFVAHIEFTDPMIGAALHLFDVLLAGAAGSLVALEAQKYVTDHDQTPASASANDGHYTATARYKQLKNEVKKLKNQVVGGQALIAILVIINIIILLFK